MSLRKTTNKVIIHCSATPELRDVKMETIRQWHLDKGWSDIGYHIVIELDGSINCGRNINKIGAHCKGHNSTSIGVCYVGGCDKDMNPKDTRTKAQKESLEVVVKYLQKVYGKVSIHGHNEFSPKACPSFNVKEWLKEINM